MKALCVFCVFDADATDYYSHITPEEKVNIIQIVGEEFSFLLALARW